MAAKKPKAKVAATIDTKITEPSPAPSKFDADDNSIDARMARLLADHQRMGARPSDA